MKKKIIQGLIYILVVIAVGIFERKCKERSKTEK